MVLWASGGVPCLFPNSEVQTFSHNKGFRADVPEQVPVQIPQQVPEFQKSFAVCCRCAAPPTSQLASYPPCRCCHCILVGGFLGFLAYGG